MKRKDFLLLLVLFIQSCSNLENVSHDEHIEGCDEKFEIQFLIKKPHSNFIFYYPDRTERSRVSRSKIVKILLDPVHNRRGGLVFKDKSILDYVF